MALRRTQPLTLNGVNRHEIRADEGRVFSEEFARRRTDEIDGNQRDPNLACTAPPLDLADEIGLWVMLGKPTVLKVIARGLITL